MTARHRLPVWPTIVGAFGFLFGNWRTALRLGWIAILATFVLDHLFDLVPDWGHWADALIGLVEMVAYVPAVAIAVVPWHRMILLSEPPAGVRLGAREGRYVLRAALLYAFYLGIVWAAYLPFAALSDPAAVDPGVRTPDPFGLLYAAGILVAWTSFLLLSPILAAVAVDGPAGLQRAFALSRGNRLRFIIVNFAAWVPGIAFIVMLPESVFEGRWAYLLVLIYAIVFVFNALIAATTLSLCYHRLGGMGGAAPARKGAE